MQAQSTSSLAPGTLGMPKLDSAVVTKSVKKTGLVTTTVPTVTSPVVRSKSRSSIGVKGSKARRMFVKMTPVLDVSFLNVDLIEQALDQCVFLDYEPDKHIQFVEWDTSWNFSPSAMKISNEILSLKVVPKGMKVILKMFE